MTIGFWVVTLGFAGLCHKIGFISRVLGDRTWKMFTFKLTALVMPLADTFDLILGDDWMCSNRVQPDPASRSCRYMAKGRWHTVPALRPASASPVLADTPVTCEHVSALQFKKFARKHPHKCFMVLTRPAPAVVASATTPAQAHEDPVASATAHCTPGVQQLVNRYRHLFKDKLPGLPPFRDVGTDVVIPLKPDARPVARPMIRLSQPEMDEVERQVTQLLDGGLIIPSSSAWGAPVLFAKKKDGTLRMVIGYHATVNPHTLKHAFPIPRLDSLLDEIAGSTVFTSLDLCSAYHQVRLAPEDVEKTTFRTHLGAFSFLVLPFGITNAPSAFQRVMAEVFRPIRKHVLLYLDDVLCHAPDPETHEKVLERAFQLLSDHQFYLKLSKCSFQMTEVNYLGHVISGGKVSPDPKKTQAVADWPTPTNVAQLRSFVGLATWFRKFIQGFSRLTLPLTALTKQNAPWVWTAECQAAFDAIKQALVSAPVLVLPDFNQPFSVVCDASDYGIGAVLLQNDRPVAYESRRFAPAELNYTVSEKEALAVIHALKVWRCYLESGQEVTWSQTPTCKIRPTCHADKRAGLSSLPASTSNGNTAQGDSMLPTLCHAIRLSSQHLSWPCSLPCSLPSHAVSLDLTLRQRPSLLRLGHSPRSSARASVLALPRRMAPQRLHSLRQLASASTHPLRICQPFGQFTRPTPGLLNLVTCATSHCATGFGTKGTSWWSQMCRP